MNRLEPRSQWSSFTSYVLVTAGAIVGLSNFFQFPFLVTKYGGLFFFFFVLCLLLVSLPMLFAELLIGRRGKQNPVGSMILLAMESKASLQWGKLGWLSFFIVFLTMCYYTVSAAFPMGYFLSSAKNLFVPSDSTNAVMSLSSSMMRSFYELEVCFLLFFFLAMMVVYRGINRGLETISCITVPLYGIILVVLAVYISAHGYFGASLANLLHIHSDIPLEEVFFAALALALLNYNTSMGIMIVYGSYLPYHVSLYKTTVVVVCIDIIVSLLTYFIIYPLILTSIPDGSVAALSNKNVITLFGSIPHGILIAFLFFFASVLGSWTPIIAMAETAVITLVERFDISRARACMIILLGVFMLGTFVVALNTTWAERIIIGGHHGFELLKTITMDAIAPLGAILLAIFAGWIIKRNITEGELSFWPIFYGIWRFLIRYVAPALIGITLIAVFLLKDLHF